MDETTVIVTIAVAIIGGIGGISSLLKTIFDYKSQKKREEKELSIEPIKQEILELRQELLEQAKAISRTQLLILMNHYPKDHQAILSELENYVLRLGGDSWMVDLATDWSSQEDVNIDYILKYHKGDKR